MIEKCSIDKMSYSIQNITLIILILILITVIIYYLKNSTIKHNDLIEKYTIPETINTDINKKFQYNVHDDNSSSQYNNFFPSKGTTVELRACQINFNNDGTSKYEYNDDWQEFRTIKNQSDSVPRLVPIKIIGQDNTLNNDEFISSNLNFSEYSRCFKKIDETDQSTYKYRYNNNDLIKYNIDRDVYLKKDGEPPEKYMDMEFNLESPNKNYFTNIKDSVCSLKYENILSNNLGGITLYRLVLDKDDIFQDIEKITINAKNNHIFNIVNKKELNKLLLTTNSSSYLYDTTTGNFRYKNILNTETKDGANIINVNIYKFNRELFCNEIDNDVKYQNIKSYIILPNKKFNINKIISTSSANVDKEIENTSFPNARNTSYSTKDDVLTHIKAEINTKIKEVNRDIITNIDSNKKIILENEIRKNDFLKTIINKSDFINRILTERDSLIFKFLISNSNLIKNLSLNQLRYSTKDVTDNEIVMSLSDEPVFSIIEGNIKKDIYDEKILEFKYNGTGFYTTYEYTFPNETTVDILLVGGGGSGGASVGGGGGAGGVVYHKNITLNGKYTINVGAGGRSTSTMSPANHHRESVDNGNSSSLILNNTIIYEAKGGGSGGTRIGDPPKTMDGWTDFDGGFNGGSGGGGSCTGDSSIRKGGIKTQGNTYYNGATYVSGGNNGNDAIGGWRAGGGGGAGGAANGMNGGQGIVNNITGVNVLYAAGGGGGCITKDPAGIGGSGIGGNGSRANGKDPASIASMLNGKEGTGSGGGGGGYDYNWIGGPNSDGGGKGGSGIVIIKYKIIRKPTKVNNRKGLSLVFNRTKHIEHLAYTKTNFSGWRIVRYLPPSSNSWYPINDNLEGITSVGTAYDYNNWWTIPFGNFDEMIFSTFNMEHWLYVLKNEVNESIYSNDSRNILKSSISSTPYKAKWYNRGDGAPEDPWIGLRDHGTEKDIMLYGENSYSNSTHYSLPHIRIDGGVCVLVRNSKDTNSVSIPNKYTISLNKKTELEINNSIKSVLNAGQYYIILGDISSKITKIDQNLQEGIYYPTTPSNNTYTWTDNGYTVNIKVSDPELGTSKINKLFDLNPDESNFKYHSQNIFTNSGSTVYSGTNVFKGVSGLSISIDLGRSIYPKRMRIKAIESLSTASPKLFKIFASNNDSCWTDNNHPSWTEIHNQTTQPSYINSQYTIINFTSNSQLYRYYTMVVTTITGNYGYLIFSEWNIGGNENDNSVIGTYDNISNGNELFITYETNKNLSEINLTNTDFTTYIPKDIEGNYYSLGNKENNKVIKYKIYIHRTHLVSNHEIRLYVKHLNVINNILSTDFSIRSEDKLGTIIQTIYYIIINKNIIGEILLEINKIFFNIDDSELNRFNNITNIDFANNVNLLNSTGTDTLKELNNMFGLSESIKRENELKSQLIILNENTTGEPIILYKNSNISSTEKNSLNLLVTTYGNIYSYTEDGIKDLEPIINTYTLNDILLESNKNNDEYKSYEYPIEVAPLYRTNTFNILNKAKKYVYFIKN